MTLEWPKNLLDKWYLQYGAIHKRIKQEQECSRKEIDLIDARIEIEQLTGSINETT